MSDTTQPVCSFADLLALLQKDGVPHEANLPGAELIIPTQRGALDAVLLLRWQQDAGVVQFIQPLPFEVPKERIPALEAAICRLNPALVVSGFELAYEQRRIGFRTTLPFMPRGGLTAEEIQAFFRVTVKTAADFLPTLSRIAQGLASPENVLADAQADMAQRQGASGNGAQGPGSLGTY